jgi:hypothetical protein
LPTGWLGSTSRARLGTSAWARSAVEPPRLRFRHAPPIPTRLPAGNRFVRRRFLSLEDLLSESDSSACMFLSSLRPAFIDESAFGRMKNPPSRSMPHVTDVNTIGPRLRKVDRPAARDVTDPEPLPPSHPLYRLPNCSSSHIGSATPTRRRMAELACANLLAGLEGRPTELCEPGSVRTTCDCALTPPVG